MVAGNESELCLLWNGSQGDDANLSPPPPPASVSLVVILMVMGISHTHSVLYPYYFGDVSNTQQVKIVNIYKVQNIV